jgi:hypothetical protein
VIPRLADRGYSFKGAGLYYLHDKHALTSDRVEWTQTRNMPIQDPEAAMKWMAYTSVNANKLKQEMGIPATGRKRERGTVYTYSLSWSPEESPDKEAMMKAADDSLKKLGLQDNEAVIVAHNDTKHPHVHVIANLVNPQDGRMHDPDHYSYFKMSDWALKHEFENNKIQCEQRVKNNELRKQGKHARYQEPRHDRKEEIQTLYRQSDNGKSFNAALEESGYTLAQGNRRSFVLVDDQGEIFALSRQLDKDQRKEYRQKLSDIDHKSLPLAQEIAQGKQQRSKNNIKDLSNEKPHEKTQKQKLDKSPEPESWYREEYHAKWEMDMIDAAIEAEKARMKAEQEAKKRGAVEKKRSSGAKSKDQPRDIPHDDSHLEEIDKGWKWNAFESRKRQELEDHLTEFYGREKMVKKLSALDNQIEKYSNTWGKVTGKLRSLQEEREALEKTLANTDMRIAEYRGAFEKELEGERLKMFPEEKETTKNTKKEFNKEAQDLEKEQERWRVIQILSKRKRGEELSEEEKRISARIDFNAANQAESEEGSYLVSKQRDHTKDNEAPIRDFYEEDENGEENKPDTFFP